MAQDLESIRKAFHQAVMDEEQSRSFHQLFSSEVDYPPSLTAYQAVSEAMLARVLWNPFSKLSQIHKYQKKMEMAISSDPDNIEIRFLRIAIEYNLPAFLGMSEHVEEDLSLIVSNMASVSQLNVDPDYGRYIFYFIESTQLCSEDEILAMRNSLARSAVH